MRLCWLVVPFLSVVASANAADLRIHGSNTIGERLAPALAEAWLADNGYTAITREPRGFEQVAVIGQRGGERFEIEVHAHGSATSARDLIDGASDLGMSSRPIAPVEVEAAAVRGLGRLDAPGQEVVVALDGLSIVVHPNNPLRQLDRRTLRRVFTGEVRHWSQLGVAGGVIAVHARDDKSGTYDSFKAMVLEGAALRGDARRYESTAELAAAVAGDRDAIGFVGMSGVQGVRALAIADGAPAVEPDVFHVAVEDYPLSRRLYLYVPTDASASARSFVRFAQSDAAQPIVARIGFVSQYIQPYPVGARADAPADYRDLVHGARRLSLNFRFGTGSSFLDSKARQDLDRLAAFMRRPENADYEMRLIGFVDASEVLPFAAWALSNDRADFIAEQLGNRRVPVARVRGMGGSVPVAANDSDRGRNRNRRVEVWLAPKQGAAGTALSQVSSGARPSP